MFFKGIDFEFEFLAVRCGDRLVFQIDGHPRVFTLFRIFHQNIDNVLGHHNRKNAVFKAVVIKDIRERRGNDGFDSEIGQCPWGVFT